MCFYQVLDQELANVLHYKIASYTTLCILLIILNTYRFASNSGQGVYVL